MQAGTAGATPRAPRHETTRNQIRVESRGRDLQYLTQLTEWLQGTSLAVYIHQTKWLFTTIEVVHVIAISVVIGSIAIVDLRLLGLASTKRPFTELAREILPWTWTAFIIAAIAGS